MEAACMAGKNVANEISLKSDKTILISRPVIFEPFRVMDNVLYKMNMPGILPILILILFLVLLLIYRTIPNSGRIIILIIIFILFIILYYINSI